MTTAINKPAIVGGANGAAGANANNVDEVSKETIFCPECDKLKRYHKKELDWVQLPALPLTAAWKIQDGELHTFGNKLCEKTLLLVRVTNLRYPIVYEGAVRQDKCRKSGAPSMDLVSISECDIASIRRPKYNHQAQ